MQEALAQLNVHFTVMAPSGVAAAIHRSGRTVHQALALGRNIRANIWSSESGRKTLDKLQHYQGVILDEVSFAGVEFMANFFECMAALQDKLAHPMHVVVVGDMRCARWSVTSCLA